MICACGTQWRVGFGGPYGLDYPAVFAVAKVLDIVVTPEVLNGIASIERAQLESWKKENEHG